MFKIELSTNLEEVYKLYIHSFPEDELMDFSDLKQYCEIYSIYDPTFIGFIVLLSDKGLCHILYFALKKEVQNKGRGTKTIEWLKEIKKEYRILADLEMPVEADNLDQRVSRIHFYEKNGFEKTDISYTWQNEKYCIYSCNGNVSHDEFGLFWKAYSEKRKV